MKLLIDMEMSYRGYHGCPSKCGIRIYEPTTREEGYVAIYTELDTNPGTSVVRHDKQIDIAESLSKNSEGGSWVNQPT